MARVVPKEKSDLRLVAAAAKPGEEAATLRLTKTVRGGDDSTYTILLPGVVPDPLKISIHPNGEIQLKTRGAGLITRLNKEVLIGGLLSRSLDTIVARFLTPKLDGEPAEGFVLGSSPLLGLASRGAEEPLKDIDLSADSFLEGLTKVQIEGTSKLGEALSNLREYRLLPVKSVLLLVTESSEQPIVFLSLCDGPMGASRPDVQFPPEFPFPKSGLALMNSLAIFGGVLFTMPSESELARNGEGCGAWGYSWRHGPVHGLSRNAWR
jgi:hypothetical protein